MKFGFVSEIFEEEHFGGEEGSKVDLMLKG